MEKIIAILIAICILTPCPIISLIGIFRKDNGDFVHSCIAVTLYELSVGAVFGLFWALYVIFGK